MTRSAPAALGATGRLPALVPAPRLHTATDTIVRSETTTICGTDLHILKGDVPAVNDGRILGHEGVGRITEVGSGCGGTAADRVAVFAPVTGRGRSLHLGASLAAAVVDERLTDGRPAEVAMFRRCAVAGRLGLDPSLPPEDPDDLVEAVERDPLSLEGRQRENRRRHASR